MNSRGWIAAVLAAGLVAPAWAQTEPAPPAGDPQPVQPEVKPAEPAAPLPEAEDILERYVEAIGGAEKMKEIKSLRIDGRYEGRPFKFAARLTLWKEAPSQFHLKIAEPAGATIEMAFDKDMGWERQPGIGVREIEGLRLVEMKDTADFWGEADWKKRYTSVQTVGLLDNFNGERAYVVHAKAPSDREKMLVFSVESGLYLGTRTLTVHPDTKKPEQYESVLGPYKEFGGVKMPTGMTQRWVEIEGPIVKIEYTNIEVNPEEKHDFGPPDDLEQAPPAEGSTPAGG
jgi:hypothetical protein